MSSDKLIKMLNFKLINTRASDKEELEPMTSPNNGRALFPLERSWVRFLSGTQFFALSHARVMLINSPFHFITKLKIHHLY